MKRFWNDVTADAHADGGHGLRLDGKPVNTPGRAPLIVPTPQLARAIADEWAGVGETVDPRAMPLTGLANAAIDRIAPAAGDFAAGLAAYGETDLLYYRAAAADSPELAARHAAHWDPLLGWAGARYGVTFETIEGVMHRPQPAGTVARLHEAVAERDAFALAGLSPVVTITGSLIAALALIEGAADRDTIWRAAQVDEDWQTEQWGEDALAAQTSAARRAEFDAGARFLSLL